MGMTIKKVFVSISDLPERSLIPSILLGISLAAPVLNFQVSFLCLAIFYLIHVWYRFNSAKPFSANYYTMSFVFFASIAGFYAIIHASEFGGDGDMYRTMELIFIFCALVMMLDAVRYLSNIQTISTLLIAKTVLFLSLVFLIIRVAYLYVSGEFLNVSELFRLSGSRNKLISINPNHADNVSIFILLMLGWSLCILFVKRQSTIIWWVLGLGLIPLYGVIYVSTNSYGGFLALGAALFAVALFLALRQREYMPIAAVLFVFVFAALAAGIWAKQIESLNPLEQAKVFMSPGAITRLQESSCIDFDTYGNPKFSDEFEIMPTATFRLAIAINAIKIWKEKPVFGHGGYDADRFADEIKGTDDCILAHLSHTHNFYLDLMVRGGLFLLFMYAVLIGVALSSMTIIMFKVGKYQMLLLLPVLGYTVYLVIENFFDLSFTGADALIAILLNIAVVWGVIREDFEFDFLPIFQTQLSSFS